ncbi:hypothetical protein X975_17345, partial [Stegodyphus mimosarum]
MLTYSSTFIRILSTGIIHYQDGSFHSLNNEPILKGICLNYTNGINIQPVVPSSAPYYNRYKS